MREALEPLEKQICVLEDYEKRPIYPDEDQKSVYDAILHQQRQTNRVARESVRVALSLLDAGKPKEEADAKVEGMSRHHVPAITTAIEWWPV